MSFIAWLKKHVCEDDAWITVHPNASGPGSPVLLDDEGYIKGGMGGKFTGQRIDLMPRKGGGGRNVSGDPREQQKDEKGFLFSGRYKLKAPTQVPNTPPTTPQNVAPQAKNTAANTVKLEITKPPTVQFEKGSAGDKFQTEPIKDLVRELCWDTPSNFYLNGLRDTYTATLKEIKTVDDKATQKELKSALETAMRNTLIVAAFSSGKLSNEDVNKMDISDAGQDVPNRRMEIINRWGKMVRETDFDDVNKQVREYITQKRIADVKNESTFPAVITPRVESAVKFGIKYTDVKTRSGDMTDDQIINTIAGGDKTKGSCASVALAYIGQKNGLDVGDFRDGKSREFFSRNANLRALFKEWGANELSEENPAFTNLNNARMLLKRLDEGKEYYFIAGKHAAIVKKTDGNFKYLELQDSDPKNNGWQNLSDSNGDTKENLKWRFGCGTRRSGAVAYEIGEVKGDAFRTALGFINTQEKDQKKGAGGSVK